VEKAVPIVVIYVLDVKLPVVFKEVEDREDEGDEPSVHSLALGRKLQPSCFRRAEKDFLGGPLADQARQFGSDVQSVPETT
jgi:hypothetical protein